MPRVPLTAALLTLLGCTAAEAGPCVPCDAGLPDLGWWDDRPLSTVGQVPVAPRIDVDEHNGRPWIAAVWEDRSTGDGDLWLATSLDWGCSFALRPLTSGASDDRAPDVALSFAIDLMVISFIRDGSVHAMASSDGGLSFSTPEPLHPTAGVDAVSPPRVSGMLIDLSPHFHVVWGENGTLHHARSVAGGATGSWQSATPVTDRFTGFSGWRQPDVAVDTRSTDPATLSAVTLVAAGVGPGRTMHEVFVVRSNDAGVTYYGDPTDPLTLDAPRRVSDPRADDPILATTRPLIDSSDSGTAAFYNWSLVAWSERRAGELSCSLDARAEEGALPTLVADWNDPPASGDVAVGTSLPATSIALIPNPLGRPPVPEFHVFVDDDTTPGAGEVHASRGTLDDLAVPTIEVLCSPYALTGQSPPRADGEARVGSFSADEDLSSVFAVWVDTRNGAERVFFKRSDSFGAAPVSVSVTPNPCSAGGGLLVEWVSPTNAPHCDEDRIRVEWGPAPFTYTDFTEVTGASSVVLTGLQDATTYYVLVTRVDEACNAWSAFEATATTPSCSGLPQCPNGIGNTLLMWRDVDDARMSWIASPIDTTHDAAASYDVYRSITTGAGGFGLLANVPTTGHDDLGAVPVASPGTRHYYQIVARNDCGTSADEPPP